MINLPNGGIRQYQPPQVVQSYLNFSGTQVNNGYRIDGTLTIYDIYDLGDGVTDVVPAGSFTANSGSLAPLAPTPNGVYQVDHLWDRGGVNDENPDPGFRVGQQWWTADINPDPTYDAQLGRDRRALRIHPDGAPRGTAGCIGLTCGETRIGTFREMLARRLRLNNNTLPLIVRHNFSPFRALPPLIITP